MVRSPKTSQDGASPLSRVRPPPAKTVQPKRSQPLAWQWKCKQAHMLSAGLARGVTGRPHLPSSSQVQRAGYKKWKVEWETQTLFDIHLRRPLWMYFPRQAQWKGEEEKADKKKKKEVGRRRHGMDRPGVRQVLEGSGEQRKMAVKSSVASKRPPRLGDRWRRWNRQGYARAKPWSLLPNRLVFVCVCLFFFSTNSLQYNWGMNSVCM